MELVLCPICRQLLRPGPPGSGTGAAHKGLPTGWDCLSWHAATTPPEVYEAARLCWYQHDIALHPHLLDHDGVQDSTGSRRRRWAVATTAQFDDGPARGSPEWDRLLAIVPARACDPGRDR